MLKGKPFTLSFIVIYNRLSLTTNLILINIRISKYLFISLALTKRIRKYL